jgi:hypothetical protein
VLHRSFPVEFEVEKCGGMVNGYRIEARLWLWNGRGRARTISRLEIHDAAMFRGDESECDGALVDLGVDGGVCLLVGERLG